MKGRSEVDVGNQWDERFSGTEFVYGREPNLWLKSQQDRLPRAGRALAVADGEGRNGVWLASRGLEVTAVDASAVGLAKAARLARAVGCAERYHPVLSLLEEWEWPEACCEVVALIYIHMASSDRPWLHERAARALAPGGLLVLEAYTPRQLAFGTGGPPDADLLYEPEDLRREFAGLEILHLEERELELEEGLLHRGRSAVVRLLARAFL